MLFSFRTRLVVASLALGACSIGPSDPIEDAFGDGTGGETGSGADEGGVQLDAAINPEGGERPCNKVDLLFVIDDSESMSDNQEELVASVPGFVDAIEQRIELAHGYHVGVVATERYLFNPGGCQAVGNLVTQTGGQHSSGAICGPWVEGNFMTDADDLGVGFSCAALVGTEGRGDEKPLDAARAALEPESACNAGFLRPDSLLVVVVITDEEDDTTMAETPFEGDQIGSQGDPPDWFADLVALRGGIESNIVVLALVGTDTSDCSAEPSPRLADFAHMFTHGFVGDVCAPSYAPFFSDAVAVVETACFDFTPEG